MKGHLLLGKGLVMDKRRIVLMSVVFFVIAIFGQLAVSQVPRGERAVAPRVIKSFDDLVYGNNTKKPETLHFDGNAGDLMRVRWKSILMKKTLYNPAVSTKERSSNESETMTVTCDIEMPEYQLVLGVCSEPIITQVSDSRDNVLDVNQEKNARQYKYSFNPVAIMERIKGGDTRMPEGWPKHPKHGEQKLDISSMLHEPIEGGIGRIKGYFNILVADSIEYIELPYEPGYEWIELTPDLQIKVAEAQNISGMYHYNIDVITNTQKHYKMIGVPEASVGDTLPSRFVFSIGTVEPPKPFAMYSGGFNAGGTQWRVKDGKGVMSGQGYGVVDKFRIAIANNPSHHEIPFEIERIPLPFEDQALSSARGSNKAKQLPVLRHLQDAGASNRDDRSWTMPAYSKSKADTKAGKKFDLDWTSITYTKELENPELFRNSKRRIVSESLSLNYQAKILNPEAILGVCRKPVVEQVVDGAGNDVEIIRSRLRTNRMGYSSLSYEHETEMPSALSRWEGRTRLSLGLPLAERNKPRSIQGDLRPVSLTVRLDPKLVSEGQRELGLVKGDFYALGVKSFKDVTVPFEVSNKWFRLTDEVGVRVAELWNDGFTNRYYIKERWRNINQPNTSMALSQSPGFASRSRSSLQIGKNLKGLYIGDSLPESFVTRMEFLGADGKLTGKPSGFSFPCSPGARGSIGADTKSIEYTIAVGPTQYKVPFEFRHIPVP